MDEVSEDEESEYSLENTTEKNKLSLNKKI